jgi:hypothetical protein
MFTYNAEQKSKNHLESALRAKQTELEKMSSRHEVLSGIVAARSSQLSIDEAG